MISNPILLVSLAGFLNGFYLLPIKKNGRENEIIWALFLSVSYMLIPTVILCRHYFLDDFLLPIKYQIILIITGGLYGLGLFLLTKSINLIGIGIPFAINIALGVLTGSFFSLVISDHINSLLHGKLFLSYGIFFLGILLSACSLFLRDSYGSKFWKKGLLYCFLGGILCCLQGACLSFFSDFFKEHQQGFFQQLIPWSLIFFSCAITFLFINREKIIVDVKKIDQLNKKNIFWSAFSMIVMQTSSVALYTIGNIRTEIYSQVYLWEIFMCCITLSSSFCSYIKKEWRNCNRLTSMVYFVANLFQLLAIVLIST